MSTAAPVHYRAAVDIPRVLQAISKKNAGKNTPDIEPVGRAMGISISGELDMPTCMQVIDERVRTLGSRLFRMSALLNVRHAEHPIPFEIVGGSPIEPACGSDQRYGQSGICITANGLDRRETLTAFEQCTWKVPATEACCEVAI